MAKRKGETFRARLSVHLKLWRDKTSLFATKVSQLPLLPHPGFARATTIAERFADSTSQSVDYSSRLQHTFFLTAIYVREISASRIGHFHLYELFDSPPDATTDDDVDTITMRSNSADLCVIVQPKVETI